MDKKEFKEIGKTLSNDIKTIVDESVGTGNLNGKKIGEAVNETVETIINDVHKMVGNIETQNKYLYTKEVKIGKGRDRNGSKRAYNKVYKQANRGKYVKYRGKYYRNDLPLANKVKSDAEVKTQPYGSKQTNELYFPHVQVGKAASVLYTVFGSITIGVTGILSIVFLATNVSTGLAISAGLLGGGLLMNLRGSFIRKRNKRYKRYLDYLLGKNRCSVEELADFAGVSERYLLKDFDNMIRIGMFPQGHISRDGREILLNRFSYADYRLEQEDKLKELSKAQPVYTIEEDKEDEALNETLIEGKQFIHEIKQAEEQIENVEVSEKLELMQQIIEQIIEYIKYHPDQRDEVRKFIGYYLPTTVKLLNAYEEFEKQTIQGDNIRNSKAEIEEALDTINLAFENLFDNLFANASMDLSSDISVMETMMTQEGLMESDFTPSENNEKDGFDMGPLTFEPFVEKEEVKNQ